MRADDVVAERVRGLLARHGDHPPDGQGLLPLHDTHGQIDTGAAARTEPDVMPGAGAASRSGGPRGPRGVGGALRATVRAAVARAAARVPVRLDPGRRAAAAVGVAVLVAAIATGAWMTASRPRALAVSSGSSPIAGASPQSTRTPAPSSSGPSSAAPDTRAAATASATDVVVDVAGKVVRPGLYHLPVGARVDDALAAAGGARRGVDLTNINLAAKVVDGQQIVVGLPAGAGAVPAAGSGVGASGAGSSGDSGASVTAPVNLNTATIDQLESLPGIGPAMGQRILDWRAAHGSFSSVDQLNDVAGIGDVKFAALKPLVTV